MIADSRSRLAVLLVEDDRSTAEIIARLWGSSWMIFAIV
jgi:hypothetical protein